MNIEMVKHSRNKRLEADLSKILSMLKDIDMKIDYLISRLKCTYSYLNSLNLKNHENGKYADT